MSLEDEGSSAAQREMARGREEVKIWWDMCASCWLCDDNDDDDEGPPVGPV